MMGIQIGGGEWLFGPEITARFGGGLLWLATIAIVLQVFYNLEVGRYALFCGEPAFTGFLRTRPGPRFWVGFFILLSLGGIIPGLVFHAATVLAALWLDRPPIPADRTFILIIAYVCLLFVFAPVLFGKKVYDTLQAIMTVKVVGVLSFCLIVGLLFVSWQNWWTVIWGFFQFGSIPSTDSAPGARLTNVFTFTMSNGRLPTVQWTDIAVIGAFVGYAGGGGLGNSLYGNYVRDKGWGMGLRVGAISSAIGGKPLKLSHIGKVFPVTNENLARWSGWWRIILIDQVVVWGPGCFVGMALPALLSLQFANNSPLFNKPVDAGVTQSSPASFGADWSDAIISADGMRHDPRFSPPVAKALWILTLVAGLLVLFPSQISVVDETSRRWTDAIWSASKRVRTNLGEYQVRIVYYSLAGIYFVWCLISLYLFGVYGTPRLMTIVIANLGNFALGLTAFQLLWINCRWLPVEIRPNWWQRIGLAGCGVMYLTFAGLVFFEQQWPYIVEMLS